MSNSLSRRDFLKGTVAGAAGIAAMGVLSACGSDTPKSPPAAILPLLPLPSLRRVHTPASSPALTLPWRSPVPSARAV